MRSGRDRLLALLRPHVDDDRVLQAMHDVPRELFVPKGLRGQAWENVPLPIGADQTISQPLVVARMCALLRLRGDERILDVGTGSGYHAAVLAQLGAHVWSVERHASLSAQAAENLAAAGVENVTLLVGDGALGLPEQAPFDAVNVAAAADTVPPALEGQLAVGGRLVVPVGHRLVVVERTPQGYERRALERVRFVPLI